MFYIDTDDYPASGIEVFTFPGGEPHANVPKWRTSTAHIFAKIRTWEDFGKLLVVVDALYDQSVAVNLFMPYLPGARQDRNTDGLTPLTPRIYSKALHTVRNITCCDPHSDAAVKVYNDYRGGRRLHEVDVTLVLADLVKDTAYDFILCPDKGAYERANKAAIRLGVQKVLTCEKTRDYETGKLSGFRVPYLSGHGLLVDDICDGGGTFIGILEAMKRQTDSTATLDLFVTHGIFSRGFEVLSGFGHVYTTNSWCQTLDVLGYTGLPQLTVADLIPYYFGGMNP